MKNIFIRLFTVIALTFILVCFLVAYPFAASWYVLTGHDLTSKIDNYLKREKNSLIK